MEILEALSKVKYPPEKMVNEETTDEENLAFNEGWNDLFHQLALLAKEVSPQLNGGESNTTKGGENA